MVRHANIRDQNPSSGMICLSTIFALLLSTPLDDGLVDRKTGCLLSANVNIICSAFLFHSPCGLSSLEEFHFFSDQGPRNAHCPAEDFFFEREKRAEHLIRILFYCL